MARQARGQSMDPREVQIFHTIQRCVRRSFLCGQDPVSGKNFEHRRQWIRDRLEFLASVFAIDVLTYAVLSNHLHLVLRSRPDVVAQWSDHEVALRWWKLCPARKGAAGEAVPPTESELNMWLHDADKIAEFRLRLSDMSWLMARLAQRIATAANGEDGCTGRFWEGRYKSQELLDEASILACAMYVDLNPIRAAIAQTPEESDFTGAKDRLDDLQQDHVAISDHQLAHDWEREGTGQRCGWMSPIEIREAHDPLGPDLSSDRRASDKGFLNVSLGQYLSLLDWTGRSLSGIKPGAIPSHLKPILERVGLLSWTWCELVRDFGKLFKRAAGSPERLDQHAAQRQQQYMHGRHPTLFADG